ncbi:MAG: hypothetical protein IAE79_00625 [Anaerolinea sp.]|nr:hypothetical protein [Anaerolinea sp.]
MNDTDLIARLQEDGLADEETAVFLPILSQLSQPPASPTAAATEALLARLLPELPRSDLPQRRADAGRADAGRADAGRADAGRADAGREWWLWLLLVAQARVVRREIWAASALVMTLGVLVSLAWRGGEGAAGLPLALLAPVVAALGIATLYSPADGVWELEMTTAVSPRLLLLARLLLVFGFNLLLAALSSVALALLLPQVSLWLLITTWLAPMTFLAALAFLITVLTGATEMGILVSLSIWTLQTVRLSGDSLGVFVRYWPDLLSPANHAWLWMLALLGFAYALWLGGREELGVARNL